MEKVFLRIIILAAGLAFTISIFSGCQTEKTIKQKSTIQTAKTANPSSAARNQPKSDKAARAAAAENIELKKQIAAKDKLIAQLKDELAKRPILKSKDLVPKAEMDKQINDLGNQMMDMLEEAMKLQEENKNLKKQIEDLKAVKQN